jgi:CheY-like chemotaxis protein
MSVITLFSGSYCQGEYVAQKIVDTLGCKLIDDDALITEAARRLGVEEGKLHRALTAKASVFNRFTHEKERSLAYLKVVLAELLQQDNMLLVGFAGHMIPRDVTHVLKVCTIADIAYRAGAAAKKEGLSEKDAIKKIHKDDESRVLWVEYLFKERDPWSPALYDMVIPMDKNDADSAAEIITVNIRKDVLKVTDASRKAVNDFLLASQVNLKLAEAGHDVSVFAEDGTVMVTINKHVLMLSSLEDELKRIAGSVPGVKDVKTQVGAGFYKSDIYRRYDFDLSLPSKVLLVDDEREFVQTLSERLQMRDLGSAVAYGGAEALSVVEEDEPEVMVLDLKMPGIDGVEVLRRVKTEHPDVEVIVLTGHGSAEVEKLCTELGACAYLEKPVDIETLTRKMQEAYGKIKQKRTLGGGGEGKK